MRRHLFVWWFITFSYSYPLNGVTQIHGPFESQQICQKMATEWTSVKAHSEKIMRNCFSDSDVRSR